MANSCCGEACITFPKFVLTKESSEQFMQKVEEYWSSHNLPSLDEAVNWTVCIAKPQVWFTHHSVVIQLKGTGKGFTVELKAEHSKGGVYLDSKYFDVEKYSHLKLTVIGECYFSANEAFKSALSCLEKFGVFKCVTKNCQDYSRALASELTGSTAPYTDVQNSIFLGAAGTIVLAVGSILAALFSRK